MNGGVLLIFYIRASNKNIERNVLIFVQINKFSVCACFVLFMIISVGIILLMLCQIKEKRHVCMFFSFILSFVALLHNNLWQSVLKLNFGYHSVYAFFVTYFFIPTFFVF